MTRRIGLAAAVLVGGVAAGARADVIELRDGRTVIGTMSRQGDVMLIKADDGHILRVPPADVVKVTLTDTQTPGEAAEAEWTRLAAEIKKADDLQTVIGLHERFLGKYPDAARAEEVRTSLGVYRQLAASGAVKFRGRWMPRAQVDVTVKGWAEAARPAVDLYRSGRLKEALDAVKGALAADGQNPDALAVGGLAAYRQNNLAQARTYFTALAAADPGSVLAENNLGVLSFVQKAAPEGLVHYTKALQAMPDNRLVLDNIAEALAAYPGDRNGAVYKALVRQYEPAEQRMEAAQAKEGLRRWGATWVKPAEYEQLSKFRSAVEDRMAKLDAQYRAARDALASLDDRIRQAQADYDQYAATVDYYNTQILLLQQRAIDVVYAISVRDTAAQNAAVAAQYKAALEAQRAQIVASGDTFQDQAGKLKAARAAVGTGDRAGQYTGVQRMMEVGEDQTPPPPAAVAGLPELPPIPSAPVVIAPPPPPTPVQPPPPQIIVVPGAVLRPGG
jgi:hypothetical protein